MSSATVDKCICHRRRFSDINKYCQNHGISTVEELQDDGICSTGCGLCIPYIRMMLKTSRTAFKPGESFQEKSESP